MQNTMPQQARDSIRNHSGRKRWRYVVTVMACIVVFCTTYALILPALTMTTDTYCGKEAHTHTQECYERVLVCGQEETEAVAGHTHTDECYETENDLVCGQEERPAHTHTAECYTSESTLTCGLEESDEHTHSEDCYAQTDTLTCGLEETEGHTHSESCYQEEKHLVCGQEETPEVAGHTHTDACYEERLACQLEEHQHTLACYSNPEADVETADVWERTLPQDLGDNWAQNVVAVAQSQLGYTESTANYTVMDDGTTMRGYTRYGAWFGDAYGDWCAMFASFCLNYAGVPQTAVPYASGCVDWVEQLQSADLYKQAADCIPQPGYLVFFDNDGDGLADHVGVVTEFDEDAQTIKTVEGNSGNAVAARSYALGDGAILGYCVLPENPDEQKEEPAETTEGEKSADADGTDKTAEGEKSADKEADIALVDDTAQVASVDDTVESIAVGETKTLTVAAGQTVKLSFVPEYTHEYVFYSSASGDTYGYLYDASGKQLTYNDDGGEGANFKITYKLTGGETYYWGTRWYSSSKTDDIPVNLEYGTHSYVADEAGDLVCVCGAVPPLSGTCGDDLTWSFDKATGTLSITGTGAMWDYYSSYNKAPWAPYASKIKNVTIDEGATSVSNYAFYNCSALESVAFPAGLTTIGGAAFRYCESLADVDLSGTALASIGSNAFYGCSSLESVAFPAGLTTIGDQAFYNCKSLTGVDLSATSLTSIGTYAFYGCSSLDSPKFPATLTKVDEGAFNGCASLRSIDFSNTQVVSIGKSAFLGCSALGEVLLPSTLETLGDGAFSGCVSLTAVAIPKSTTSVGRSALYNCNALKELRLEASNVTFDATQSALDGFHVTVANTVDTLSAATMTTLNTMGCTSITFEGPHYLTVESWQGDFLPEVLVGRSAGEYYVDDQGVLYRIDSETNTASVFYCPAGIGSYTVPKELPAKSEGGQAFSVTGVDGFAFADAADLTSITFEAPEAITTLADRAFSRATNLESINGKTTSAEVLATFTSDGLKYGSMLFSQTKITDDGVSPSAGALKVEKDDLTLTVSTEPGTRRNPAQSDDGTYCYYTGEDAQTTITVSSGSEVAQDGTVVRVYFQFDSSKGTLNYPPGTYKVVSDSTKNEYEMTVVKTDSPNCYYAEFERPEQGDTISFILTSSYPSPTSGGGDAVLWGGILTAGEKEALGSGLLPIEAYQSLDWTTKVDTFPVSKTEYSTGSSKLVGNGDGSAYISGLRYNIKMSRSGDTLEGVGKDHMSSVDYKDVLTLPEGVTLAEDVKRAIEDGTVTVSASSSYGYQFKIANGRTFLTLQPSNYSTNYQYLRNGSVSLDDNDNLVVSWSFRNAKPLETEMSDMTFAYMVEDKTLIVAEPKAGVTYTVDNAVQATEHFMYSADQYQAGECSVTVKTAAGSLTMKKTGVAPYGSDYGSPRGWKITVQNPGALPYDKLAYITDDLSTTLYMRPADLASIFADDTEHQLTVTINNATFCTVESDRTITGVDGSSGTMDPQNSGSGTAHGGTSSTDPDYSSTGTITVSWGTDGNLQIATGDSVISCAAEEGAIESALQSLGFVVTSSTQYCLSWDLRNDDGTVPPFAGGAKIEKNVYSTYKDTFMLLGSDTYHQHPTSSIRVSNSAVGRDENGTQLANGYDYYNVYREFYLSKNWSMDGKAIEEDAVIRQGDILDYSLAVSHSGSAQYDALPLVDHMSGVQALLAPVDKNSGADWASGLQTVMDNGTEYYILNQPGTYKNVWVSDSCLADTVEVTNSDSGLDTLITWYFVDYTGSRADTISYRAYVCPSDDALTYSLNNECWLNDRASHRLYDTLPGWRGTSLAFDKVIADNVGDTGEGYRNSNVSEGQTVVYRLSLTGSTDKDGNPQTMTVTGEDMYDTLPLSIDGYRWSKDYVKVTYAGGESCTVTNGDSWSVDGSETDSNQQYLKWSDDFSLTFTGTAYIYVELTFPSGDAWQNYAVAYGATTLTNTFHVLGGQRSVTHQLAVSAQVYLQKGVYDTGYVYSSSRSYKSDLNIEDDRLYYQNNDSKIRAVRYYVALYNGGLTNLYLTDMQDLLPRGFTLLGKPGTTSTSTGTSYVTVEKEVGSYASMKYANVTTSTSTGDDGRQLVTFSFSGTTSTYLPISYDKEKGLCYLKPGEAIAFSYTCYTNEAADTDDAALNTVVMPYYDFNGGGVVVDEGCTVIAPNSNKYTPNDGGCDVLDNGQAEDLGFNGQTSDTQWLASDVALVRGSIKPGITKALTSKTNESGTTTVNPSSALPRDTLTWTVTTENDGTNSIVDYALTDRMESPYMFTGKVSYNIYGDSQGSNLVAASNSSDYLFTIASGSDSDHLLITPNRSSAATELTIGGDPVTVKCAWKYSLSNGYTTATKTVDVQLSISRDADGNAVMSLRFPDSAMGIPEGGLSKLTLSTKNTTGSLQNKQFINTCFITPLSQTWDNTTNRGNITTLDTPYAEGDLSTVRNSAPVTTSYGYTTSSLKSVTEVDSTANTAKCTDDTNYIVLSDKTKLFRYTVEVGNTTPKAMDKLILIDGLPEVGDHTAFSTTDPRFSEFKVSLADVPEFVVTVTDENGGVTTLDSSAYTIEYSTKTDFDSSDWNGTSTWSSDAAGARSIRLKVIDSEGTLIPASSTISLNFTCKIDGDVEPGQVAWNSFGYHYKLKDNTAELEAAPLKVGVKIPAVPELLKKVVDHSGQARTVDKDTEFNFLVYQGAALSGTYATREELIEALGDTPYDEFTVTVKAGQSASDSVRMSTTKWAWTEGQKYTVVELPCGEDYALKRFVGSAANTYTLTYAQAQTQVVTCENTALRWSIDLTKENTSHEALAGAVFALYSPSAADQLDAVPEGYADLNIGLTVEHGGKTWYLKDVSTTPDTGKLTWSDLLQAQYYLLEIKAPDGYNRGSTPGQVIQQNKETQGVYSTTVVNRSGFSLPETGGVGTHPYTLGGLLLLIGAASLLLYRSVRRRRGDTASA